MAGGGFWQDLAAAVRARGTDAHVDRLIDAVASTLPHDFVTVTRYSASAPPEFVRHRGLPDAMVARYLDTYHQFDPFHAHWRDHRAPGVLPLSALSDAATRRGRYVAEFLAQSTIRDEVGLLLPDGGDRCLGIFLDRAGRPFRVPEVAALRERYAVFAALHASDLAARRSGAVRPPVVAPPRLPEGGPDLPPGLWPELSPREVEVVRLILAGHPTATIARRLGIAAGTAKNHRRRIYDRLDITTERELFVQFFQFRSAERTGSG